MQDSRESMIRGLGGRDPTGRRSLGTVGQGKAREQNGMTARSVATNDTSLCESETRREEMREDMEGYERARGREENAQMMASMD